ncbi:MAG: hypothetical protein ACR2LC_09470 [Pyrinomonadaceae bacterium]
MSTQPYILCFWKDDTAGRVWRVVRTSDGVMIANSRNRETIEGIAAWLNQEPRREAGNVTPAEAAQDATRVHGEHFDYEHYGRVIAERQRRNSTV